MCFEIQFAVGVTSYTQCSRIIFVHLFHAFQVGDNYYRPDLKKAALARLSAVNRSLKVAKSGVKKRNRQAMKIRGRK